MMLFFFFVAYCYSSMVLFAGDQIPASANLSRDVKLVKVGYFLSQASIPFTNRSDGYFLRNNTKPGSYKIVSKNSSLGFTVLEKGQVGTSVIFKKVKMVYDGSLKVKFLAENIYIGHALTLIVKSKDDGKVLIIRKTRVKYGENSVWFDNLLNIQDVYLEVLDKKEKVIYRVSKIDFLVKFSPEANSTYRAIPKIVWAFWDSTLPEFNPYGDSEKDFARACFEAAKRQNPDYQFILLNMKNVRQYIRRPLPDNFDTLIPAKKSDWVRLSALAENGGIYMDLSMIWTRSFNWTNYRQKTGKEIILFYSRDYGNHNYFYENWFIAAPPNAFFIRKWLQEYEYIIDFYKGNGQLYLNEMARKGYNIFNILPKELHLMMLGNYLACYNSYRKLLIDGVDPNAWSINALDNALKLPWVMCDGDKGCIRDKLFEPASEAFGEQRVPSTIKLSHWDRVSVIQGLQTGLPIQKDSVLYTYLGLRSQPQK